MTALILASQSAVRAELLRRAGLDFTTLPAQIDETSLIASLKAEGADPRNIADALAELKAQRVSNRRSDAFVIGADQLLVCENAIFEKPGTREAATAQLAALSGKTHQLICAVVIARGGHAQWRHVETARLTMRYLSPEGIARYLDEAGAAALQSVGAYQLEGIGVQLFDRLEGDYFTILGLPLLALLHGLREMGAIEA